MEGREGLLGENFIPQLYQTAKVWVIPKGEGSIGEGWKQGPTVASLTGCAGGVRGSSNISDCNHHAICLSPWPSSPAINTAIAFLCLDVPISLYFPPFSDSPPQSLFPSFCLLGAIIPSTSMSPAFLFISSRQLPLHTNIRQGGHRMPKIQGHKHVSKKTGSGTRLTHFVVFKKNPTLFYPSLIYDNLIPVVLQFRAMCKISPPLSSQQPFEAG